MSKALSVREAAVLRVLLANEPYGSNGPDLVRGLRNAGEGGVTGVPVAGVHRTAASLCRKDLAWRAGTTKMQFYKITRTGRDVLDGRPAPWRLPAQTTCSRNHRPGEHDASCVPPADPANPELRLLRAIYGLCALCDRTEEHRHSDAEITAAGMIPDARPVHPVIYAPSGEEIGRASTERGAKSCAARIPKLECERWTANLAERLGNADEPAGLAWFVGPQLRQRRR